MPPYMNTQTNIYLYRKDISFELLGYIKTSHEKQIFYDATKGSVNTMTNRKHHVKDKQITTLSGWFHSPLRVGERAIISGVNGFSILTSPILTILEVSNDSIVFETENTIYHLVHTPETVSEVMCA